MLQAPGGSDPSLCSAQPGCAGAAIPSLPHPHPRAKRARVGFAVGLSTTALTPTPSSHPGFGLRVNPSRSFPSCDAAGIAFTAWAWSCFLSPRAKHCPTCDQPTCDQPTCELGHCSILLQPQLDRRAAQEERAQLGMFSLSTSQVFVSSLEKLLLGGWEGDTCVVTSMSLAVLAQHPTAGCHLCCVGAGMVQQQLLGSFPSSALSMLLLHRVLGPLQLLSPGFSISTDTSSLGRGGKEQPVPSRARGSCLHQHYRPQQNTDQGIFSCFFPPFHSFFVLTSDAQNIT